MDLTPNCHDLSARAYSRASTSAAGAAMQDGSYIYPEFDALPDPSHRPMYLATVLDLLAPIAAGSAVLDAGCGGGDFAEGLAGAGYLVFGTDLSDSALAHAEARGIGRFAKASLYEPLAPPHARRDYDAIVCVEVIEHLYSPQRFAAQAFAALRPGGILIVTTPYWGYAKTLLLALTNRIDRAHTTLWEGGHIKHFSRATLGKLMVDAGFATAGFAGCGAGLRAHVPGLWQGMAAAFRKPVIEG
jgi:2-polyprenyl-6-hydroxyphenyl methylase/3-demethylubiquinone-9 3-methyltransferase